MILDLIRTEWFKLRKSKIGFILLIGPLMGLMIGMVNPLIDTMLQDSTVTMWIPQLLVMNLTYALLFLPLITAVLTGLVCRYEYQQGGWKQLLSLPVTRSSVFIAKFSTIMILVFMIQVLYVIAVFAAGTINGISDSFPLNIIWKSIFGGWIATFPLVALQLWMSLLFRSFAAPFAVNVMFTLPTILVVNSEKFGPLYPWAQPFNMMYIGENAADIFFIPLWQMLVVVGGSFLLFFCGGLFYFYKKMI